MYRLFLLLLIPFVVFSAYNQPQFQIATYWDPILTGTDTEDEKRLQECRDAGFTILTSAAGEHTDRWIAANGYGNNYVGYGLSLNYKGDRLKKIPGLKMLWNSEYWSQDEMFYKEYTDSTFMKWTDITSPASYRWAVNEWFRTTYKDVLEGYFLGDEPSLILGQLPIVQNKAKVIASHDPNGLLYVNFYGPNEWTNYGQMVKFADWRTYITEWIKLSEASVFIYDQYLFFKNSVFAKYNQSEVRYFSPMRIAIEQVQKYGKQWWFTAGSYEDDGHAQQNIATMRFQAHSALLYGAKGLTWFTYASAFPNYNAFTKPDGTINPPIYNAGKAINNCIHNMGPTIMGLTWIETFHGTSTCPTSGEKNLATLATANQSVVTYISSQDGTENLAVGVFNGNQIAKNVLMVMNKNVTKPIKAIVWVNGGPFIQQHKKNEPGWVRLSSQSYNAVVNRTAFELTILPGDIELLKINHSDIRISPAVNTLLLN